MDKNRKQWNDGQQKLRQTLLKNDRKKAVDLFLSQHAMVHCKEMSRIKLWSFEDDLWQGLTEEDFHAIPPGGEHSIAWVLFHIARIEDLTMNMLIADSQQLYLKEGWAKKLKATISHSANRMDHDAVVQLSSRLDMTALRQYRLAVGRRTRAVVKKIQLEEFKQKVNPLRLQNILDAGAIIPEAMEIVNYWSKCTIVALLLMPPTRHNFLHLNEAMRIKTKLQRNKK